MKNIANNQGKIEQNRQIFSLHVRYLTFLSALLLLFSLTFLAFTLQRSADRQAQSQRESAFTGLLYTSFSDAADGLRKAGESDSVEFGRSIRTAGEAIERMRGGCALYGTANSDRLDDYLAQLSGECDRLSRNADAGFVSESDRNLCQELAKQIARITESDGTLLSPEKGRMLDQRISPFLYSKKSGFPRKSAIG